MDARIMPHEPPTNGANHATKLSWAPIMGQWEITEANQNFRGEGPGSTAHGQFFPMGLAVSSAVMQNGMSQAQIRFSAPFGDGEQAGGIVLGYRSPEQHYIFAELGGARSAYSIGEYVSGFGWRPLSVSG